MEQPNVTDRFAADAKLFIRSRLCWSRDLELTDTSDDARATVGTKDIVPLGYGRQLREIEELLAAHPATSTTAVGGVPDEQFGLRTYCYIVPSDSSGPPTLTLLKEYLHSNGIALHKPPDGSRTPRGNADHRNGKIQKHAPWQNLPARSAGPRAATPVWGGYTTHAANRRDHLTILTRSQA